MSASATELSRHLHALYGVPLAMLLSAALVATMLGASDAGVAVAASCGLVAAMAYLRLRRSPPPAFELIVDERN